MKIFVFEYITGGGLVNEAIAENLAYEGDLMLIALLKDLLTIKDIEVCITRDARLRLDEKLLADTKLSVAFVNNQKQFAPKFSEFLTYCEACWPIAPETDNILENVCISIEKAGKILLSSPSTAVKLTGNKLLTSNYLLKNGIATAHSVLINDHYPDAYPVVIKPIDGVAGEDSYLIKNIKEYERLIDGLDDTTKMIVQPFITGSTLSLSALFSNGKGQLLSCNEQKTEIYNQQFKLRECRVNIFSEMRDQSQSLVEQIALIIPELWGYAGIDCVVTEAGLVVLEINPRLTTSFAVLSEALQMNIAKEILSLLNMQVGAHRTTGKPVTIKFPTEVPDAA